MPVESEYTPAVYNCNGTQTEFSFSFKIFQTSELKVYLRDTTVDDPNEGQTLLTEGASADYTVSAPNNDYSQGGKVTTNTAYSSDYKIVITRDVAETQTGKYIENDNFPSSLHQNIVDKLCMLVQERKAIDVQLLRLAITSEYENLTIPDPVANYLLAWKADLTGLKNVTGANIGDLTVSDWIKNNLLDDADAAAVRATLDVLQDIADVIQTSHIADEAISTDHLAATASYKNAVTRYFVPTLVGWSNDISKVEPDGLSIKYETISGAVDEARVPVNLPDGAIVTEFKAWIKSDGTQTLQAQLRRSPLDDGSADAMATVNTSQNTTQELTDDTITNATIDNQNYTYFVDTAISGSPSAPCYVYGVRIKYTIAKPLP